MPAFCPSCGNPTTPDASFCARCGTSLVPAYPTADAPAQATAPPRSTETAENLILAGAILGAVLLTLGTLLMLLMMVIFGGVFGFGMMGGGGSAGLLALTAVFGVVALVVVALTIVWTVLCLRARRLLREGDVARGSMHAIVLGAIMLVVGLATFLPAIAGGLVLAGGLLARDRAPAGS